MSDPLNQQISAFLDDELPPEECALLLRRLGQDDALGDTVNRYALIGDAMRGELLAADRHVVERIRAALIDDVSHVESTESERVASGGWPSWLRPVSGLAVAATVATVAVLSLQGFNQADNTEFPANTVADIAATDSGALVPVNVPRIKLPDVRPASVMPQSRMDQYLLRHRGYANGFGRQSVMGIRDLGTTFTITAVPSGEGANADTSVPTQDNAPPK